MRTIIRIELPSSRTASTVDGHNGSVVFDKVFFVDHGVL